MQLSKMRNTALAAVLAMLAGCATQPPYQRPAMPLPARFKQATPEAAAAGIWQMAQPQDAALPQEWWRLFGDPELDRLQQQAANDSTGNPGIAQAVARLRAAQAAVAGSRPWWARGCFICAGCRWLTLRHSMC